MKGSCKARFQKSRSTAFGKRKTFNTRFDVLSQDVESSKTPSSSPRLAGFCESPSLVNTGNKVEEDDARALRQLELCLRVHAKIASGVYPAPSPGTLSGPARSVTPGSVVRADGRPVASRDDVNSRVPAIVDGAQSAHFVSDCVSRGPHVSCVAPAGGSWSSGSRPGGRPLGADPAGASSGVSRASEHSLDVQPLCVGSAARGDLLEIDGLGKPAHATACESEENLGFREVSINSSNSSMGVACVDPAIAAVASPASASSCPCPLASRVAVAVHARHTVTSMHAVTAHNSWSDTGRLQGPTGRRCTKGGVSGSAKDLLPVSEVEAGVNFRPVGCVRGQVAGSLPRRQPGTGTRRVGKGVVTPSLHPEVPGIQFVSPGRGLDIRQSMAGRRCVKPLGRGFGC